MTTGGPPQPIAVMQEQVTPSGLAVLYLQLELAKVFPGQAPTFYQQLTGSIATLPARIGEEQLWQLLAGFSEGYQLNWVHRLLTDTSYTWQLERLHINDIRMSHLCLPPVCARIP